MTRQPVSPICPADDIPVGSCIVPTNQTTPTTEPPKVPGWYWVKFVTPSGLTYRTISSIEQSDIDNAQDAIDGHWFAGPIQEPGCDEGE